MVRPQRTHQGVVLVHQGVVFLGLTIHMLHGESLEGGIVLFKGDQPPGQLTNEIRELETLIVLQFLEIEIFEIPILDQSALDLARNGNTFDLCGVAGI